MTGDFRMNREHPPLVKLAGALAIMPLRPVLPLDDPSWERANQWDFGKAFLDRNKGRVEAIVAWSRLPTAILAGLLVAITGLWAWEAYGWGASILAMVFLGALPEVLSHGRWLTMDVPSAAFGLLALYAAWKWFDRPGTWRAAAVGLAFGAALGAKFSLLAWPAWLAVLALARWFGGTPRPARREGLELALWLVLGPLLVLAVCYLDPAGLWWYGHELRTVNANHRPGYEFYLAGHFGSDRLPGYFVQAFLLKTPLPGLLAIGAGVLAGLAAAWRRSQDWPLVVTLLGCAAIWLCGVEEAAHPLGLRYLIPAFPLLAILAARLAAVLAWRGTVPVLGLLAAGLIGSAGLGHRDWGGVLGIQAGRPEIPPLDDCNIDWGQGLIQLREFMKARGIARIHFGSPYGVDPAWYGIAAEPVDPASRGHLRPGWYAFSRQFTFRVPGFLWLEHVPGGWHLSGLTVQRLEGDVEQRAQAAFGALERRNRDHPALRSHLRAFRAR